VALLLQALLPTNPGRDALQSVLDKARRRVSLAAAASFGDAAADMYQNAVQDELDVLQLFLESREGNWPSPAGELFHRLCPDDAGDNGQPGHGGEPSTHAGIFLLSLAAQGLSVHGKAADAVVLSTRALNAVERLPRCSIDFHSMVLTIHAANLARLGQSPGPGNAAEPTGSNKWMSYPGGPLQLFRAMMFCRHAAADRAAQRAPGMAGGASGDPEDLLALTLGAQATAEWMTWDLAQGRGAPQPSPAMTSDGDISAKLAETYAVVARPAVTGAVGPPARTPRKPARAVVLPGTLAPPRGAEGTSDWSWSTGRSDRPVPPGPRENRLAAADPSKLSQREREVAVLVVSGMGSAQVAKELGIAVNTVNAHLQRIYGKLGVSRRQELAELWSSLDAAGL
jgi:DNA-binding CsgD family transcriptional regulator